jgi:hypothetical protein
VEFNLNFTVVRLMFFLPDFDPQNLHDKIRALRTRTDESATRLIPTTVEIGGAIRTRALRFEGGVSWRLLP